VQPWGMAMNLVDLDTFVRVGSNGSFTSAAKELGVPKSTVSRRVGRLEDALGLALLVRTGRSVRLTQVGERLWQRTRASLREVHDAERELLDAFEEPAGVLRLTAPHDVGVTGWFSRLITSYRARHPGVVLEIELTNRIVDLVGEGFDAALRPAPDSGSSALVGRKLATITAGIFASPDYISRRGVPREPEGLLEHDCVAHSSLIRGGLWQLSGPDGQERELDIQNAILVNDFNLVVQAVVDGAGVGLVPSFAAEGLIGAGEIVEVLPGWGFGQGSLFLVWPSSRHLASRVRAFVDHTVAAAAELQLTRSGQNSEGPRRPGSGDRDPPA